MKPKLRVAVLFGGRSGEHEVSLLSAATVLEALDRRRYAVTPIGIAKNGRWRRGRDGQSPAEVLRSGRAARIDPWPGGARFDVVVPMLHGTYGEDGTLQGLLELAGVAYVGAGVLGAAAAMDKAVMKRLFAEAGLPVVPWRSVNRAAWEAGPGQVMAGLRRAFRFPLFVKPANLGSSVGISKVHNAAELAPALALAARFDAKLIVERGVTARELECAVLGNAAPAASLPGELFPAREFYDYAAKYTDDRSRTAVPARLTRAQLRQVQAMACRAFLATECSGLARVDFFLERESGRLYVNEINTMPGFTAISMYPKMWAASGLALPKLLDRLIELALQRRAERSRNLYRFASGG